METVLGTVLGVVVALAGFWAYIAATFQSKEVAAAQQERIDEKLDGIRDEIRGMRATMESSLVRNTVDETINTLAEVLRETRIPIRERDRH